MNELRFILLAIGIVIILGIYFWETARRKKNIRSRVENYPPLEQDSNSPTLSPRKEGNLDISAALSQISSYLRLARKTATEPLEGKSLAGIKNESDVSPDKQEIISFYIIAKGSSGISGTELLHEMEAVDMQFGEMNIFHRYYETDGTRERLFSLANICEPGNFDPDKMASFTTSGVALFMCLPAGIKGNDAFDMMLDAARQIATDVNGQLCDSHKQPLDAEKIEQIRAIAAAY